MSSADIPGVPGSSGLILGDILGRNAGDTCTELTLDLFLLPFGPISGVFRALRVGVGVDVLGVSRGLGFADVDCAGFESTGDGRV